MEAKITIYESDGTTPAFVFEGDDLIFCQYEQHSSFAGTELNNDTMTATVKSENPSGSDQIVSSSGDSIQCNIQSGSVYSAGNIYTLANKSVIGIPRGAPADLTLHDEDTLSNRVINYIFDSARMISSGYYTLDFMSPMTYLGERSSEGINTYIGRPSQSNTVGSLVGVFNQRAGLGNLLSALTPISSVAVNGIIEASESIRDAICKIQMAAGACIVNGDTLEPVNLDGTPDSIPEDNCGNQTITYPDKSTAIYLISWNYDNKYFDVERLFDSAALPPIVLSGSVIDYDIDAPYTKFECTLNLDAVSGLFTPHITIDTNVDYVGMLTIYKQKFLPTTHELRAVLSGEPSKVVKIESNKLITKDNWQSISEKLIDYYARTQKHEVTVYDKLLHTNHVYEFTDATGARKTGILTDINVQISHILASRCTFITDY